MSDLLFLLAGLIVGASGATAVLLPALRQARASLSLLQIELNSARRERGGFEAELAAAHDVAETQSDAIRAENAELRRRMDELADAIMRREGVSVPSDPPR